MSISNIFKNNMTFYVIIYQNNLRNKRMEILLKNINNKIETWLYRFDIYLFRLANIIL
jgi:hypothetical protein